MADMFWTKQGIDNERTPLETTKGSLHCPKITWTLIHKLVQTGPTLLDCCILLRRLNSKHKKKHDIYNQKMRRKNCKGSPMVYINFMHFGLQTAKMGEEFYSSSA